MLIPSEKLKEFVEFSNDSKEIKILKVPEGHQELMDIVYGIWNSENYLGEKDRLYIAENCGPKFKVAVQLGNFNYQVGNGGVSQWVYNNYAVEDILDIITILTNYIETISAVGDNSNLDIEVSNNILKVLNEIVNYSDPKKDKWIMDCPYCDGTGVEDDEEDEDAIYTYGATQCFHCGGSGTEKTTRYHESLDGFNYDHLEKTYLFNENKDVGYYAWDTMLQRILDKIDNG